VADRVFLGRRVEPERPTARRLGGRLEDRVVAETTTASWTRGDAAAARAPRFGGDQQTSARSGRIGQDQGQDADVPGTATLGGETAKAREQLRVVLGVGRGLAGEASCSDARPAIERVDLETRVVGQGRQPGQAGVEARLEPGVRGESLAVLDGLLGQPDGVERDEPGSGR
jgi:hypothetical protein